MAFYDAKTTYTDAYQKIARDTGVIQNSITNSGNKEEAGSRLVILKKGVVSLAKKTTNLDQLGVFERSGKYKNAPNNQYETMVEGYKELGICGAAAKKLAQHHIHKIENFGSIEDLHAEESKSVPQTVSGADYIVAANLFMDSYKGIHENQLKIKDEPYILRSLVQTRDELKEELKAVELKYRQHLAQRDEESSMPPEKREKIARRHGLSMGAYNKEQANINDNLRYSIYDIKEKLESLERESDKLTNTHDDYVYLLNNQFKGAE